DFPEEEEIGFIKPKRNAKVEQAVTYWENTLQVLQQHGTIWLDKKCVSNEVRYYEGVRYCKDGCQSVSFCGDVKIPIEHLRWCVWWDSHANVYHNPLESAPGVAGSDFILYVAALHSDKCERQKTVAFAAHCQMEQALDSIQTSIHKHTELLYTIKHEILHALGFTASLYAFYRDQFGHPLTERDQYTGKPLVFDAGLLMYKWSDRVVSQVTRPSWRLKGQTIRKTVNMIITPNVVREVRAHFGCPNLEGGELEDQGINGTAITHWEKRVFENEFMTGTYTQNPYENAGNLEWGQGMGCDFVMKSCYHWMETKINNNEDIHPFCIHANRGQLKTDCTRNRKAVAICNLTVEGVPASDVNRYGGSVSLADYCPYLQEFVWKQEDSLVRGSRCALTQNRVDPTQNYLLETYGPQSACFHHGSEWSLLQCDSQFKPHYGSGCYEYRCDVTQGLQVIVMGQAYTCYYAGQQVLIGYVDPRWLHQGNITCPPCQELCQSQGITCPPERRDIYDVHPNANTNERIPCAASFIYSWNLTTLSALCISFKLVLDILYCYR
ncbi:LMLN-like protein, partial [Mya arenaria]